MKKLFLILLLPVGHFLCAQNTTKPSLVPQNTSRWTNEFGVYYAYSNPSGSMGTIIQQGHGGGIYCEWINPNERFAFGLDFTMSLYGHDKSRQEYEMDDGTLAPMDIIVSNTFLNIMGYARWLVCMVR